ncbi:hypothetical protein [Actinomadura oligospora]|uniref:hypothetical protein n=1 Tax=Actinomadura oligospora TaxID=111804 RepID=UPI0004B0EC6C|nr:hypothetical protein [Actinomadura oligospora]
MGTRPASSFVIYEGTGEFSRYSAARFDGDAVVIDFRPNEDRPMVHVECVEGRDEGADWAGFLQVVSDHNKGKWIDSSDGWVTAVSSKSGIAPVWFVDKGGYYELWQGRDKDRPLSNWDGKLRFSVGARKNPGRFNIK